LGATLAFASIERRVNINQINALTGKRLKDWKIITKVNLIHRCITQSPNLMLLVIRLNIISIKNKTPRQLENSVGSQPSGMTQYTSHFIHPTDNLPLEVSSNTAACADPLLSPCAAN
jgi:hypothetical protein